MTEIQHRPCPYCQTLTVPQDTLCPKCGKPVHTVMEKTVIMSASRLGVHKMQPAPRKGLNGRQRAFLWRYIFPVALFTPLFFLIVFLLKMPSVSVIDWLVKPVYRPSPNALFVRQIPGWLLATLVDGMITAAIVRLIAPPTWEDITDGPIRP